MLVFILTTLTAMIVSLSYLGSAQVKYLKDNWSELRCNPIYMPMASYVGVDPFSNFTKCIGKGFDHWNERIFKECSTPDAGAVCH